MQQKEYRFFYHYYKQRNGMSVHFKKQCYLTRHVICNVPCETKYNKTQPYLVMQGKAKQIEILSDRIIIS